MPVSRPLHFVATSLSLAHGFGFFGLFEESVREPQVVVRDLQNEEEVVPTDGDFELITEKACEGKQTESAECLWQWECNPCVPIDCLFGDWSDWSDPSALSLTGDDKVDCTRLCQRTRPIVRNNSACGSPCTGAQAESKRCLDAPSCYQLAADCVFTAWSPWTLCHNSTSQSSRTRKIAEESKNGGAACNGALTESWPCSEFVTKNCTFSEWDAWTECSATCNGGTRSRIRHVVSHATRFGSTCNGAEFVEDACNTQDCPGKMDCVMGAWDAWSKCQSLGYEKDFPFSVWGQQTRKRYKSPVELGGKGCTGAMHETQGCKIEAPESVDCQFSQWSPWTVCSKSCDGGQRHRSRTLLNAEEYGGKCSHESLHETGSCMTVRCGIEENSCRLTPWTPWSLCNSTCGEGVQRRKRSPIEAQRGGYPCSHSILSEVKGCEGPKCNATDCTWGAWDYWGICSHTCGEGWHERTRKVVAPKYGGKCEAKTSREGQRCNLGLCPGDCAAINGTWGSWGLFSACSASCGNGYQKRTRTPGSPNSCGYHAIGLSDEYRPCTNWAIGCTSRQDCQLSEWTQWSACDVSTCRGASNRKRTVTTFASGGGKSCGEFSLEETRICPWTAVCQTPADCEFTDWEPQPGTTCTKSCGGGSISMIRKMHPLRFNGSTCDGSLIKVEPCNTKKCPGDLLCVDCSWGPWSEWDVCLTYQSMRTRSREIKEYGNFCGRKCDPKVIGEASVEIESCEGLRPEVVYCTWAAWSDWDACPTACSSKVNDKNVAGRSRTRVLHEQRFADGALKKDEYLVKSTASNVFACNGRQGERDFCPSCSCQPVSCELSDWSEWTLPVNVALCTRSRTVIRKNNECGSPCEGPLGDTKKCSLHLIPVDCIIGTWSTWSACSNTMLQRRVRHIERYSENGGKPCAGVLQETFPCDPLFIPATNCSTTPWSEWGECSAPCQGGTQQRVRAIATKVQPPGLPCEASLQQLRLCEEGKEKCIAIAKDCTFKAWGDWSSLCTGRNQRFRTRDLDLALSEGKPCEGSVKETEECANGARDCQMSQWTVWTQCDTACGPGSRQRHRVIHQHPSRGGKPCPVTEHNGMNMTDTVEVETCNEDKPCSSVLNCQVSQWQEWRVCTTSCGVGQQIRKRYFDHKMTFGGVGCMNLMTEVRACLAPRAPCYRDCTWNQWSPWATCTRTCGGGHRSRYRAVLQSPTAYEDVPGVNQSTACSAKHSIEHVEACNKQECVQNCTDGRWSLWSAWSQCSSTCIGGHQWKSRKVVQQANHCGKVVNGSAHKVRPCNEQIPCQLNQDCQLSIWSEWSTCSDTCAGISERNRRIAVHPHGNGSVCTGSLHQTRPCGGLKNSSARSGCLPNANPKACVMSSWTAWSICSVTCGTGESKRSRAVVQHGNCSGSLNEVKGCNAWPCKTPADCTWNDWGDWGDCDVCGGQRHRSRTMFTSGHDGGKLCDAAAAKEVGTCPRKCHGKYLCAWGDWGEWSQCSTTCGFGGQRTRARSLKLINQSSESLSMVEALWDSSESHMQQRVQELYRQSQRAEAQRTQQLSIAFLSGCISLVIVSFVVRWLPSRTNTTGSSTFSRLSGMEPVGGVTHSSLSRTLSINHVDEDLNEESTLTTV